MIAPALDSGSLSFGPSDESLMQSIVDRKDRAIAALYDRHAKTLKKIIYQVLQDDAEADDVLQESILQI